MCVLCEFWKWLQKCYKTTNFFTFFAYKVMLVTYMFAFLILHYNSFKFAYEYLIMVYIWANTIKQSLCKFCLKSAVRLFCLFKKEKVFLNFKHTDIFMHNKFSFCPLIRTTKDNNQLLASFNLLNDSNWHRIFLVFFFLRIVYDENDVRKQVNWWKIHLHLQIYMHTKVAGNMNSIWVLLNS